MKRKITLLLLAAGSLFKMNSQVVLTENFTEPFNPAAAGWVVINNSAPTGTVGWTQGNQTGGNNGIPAFNGAADDFYMADFMSTTYPGAGDISAFLITPTLTIYNGAVIQFATRTLNQTAPNIFADRLQVLLSQTGNTVIPAGANQMGSFSTVLLDINPNLTTNNASAVNNGTVNGYPFAWTVYNVTVSGLAGPVTGRFAFRYFVPNGGASGANSRLIGVDAVKVSLPCSVTVPSYTICAGESATIQATGASAGTTYTWSTGSNNSSVVVAPAGGVGSSTTYSLDYDGGSGACPTVTSEITIGGQLSVIVSASSTTICSGNTVTLSAMSSAQSFSWNTGATSAVTTVTPNGTTTYSVLAWNGSPIPTCGGLGTVQITVNQSPTLGVAIGDVCLGGALTVTASGATTYTFLGQNTNPASFPLAAIGATLSGGYTFGLGGTSNGCSVAGIVSFTVNDLPVVGATTSSASPCTNSVITISGSGADDYQWSGASTATTSSFTYSSATAGNKVFVVTGTDNTTGCSNTATVNVNVKVCNLNTVGIANINGNDETGIFPNPFTTEIKINSLDGKVVVYNAIGQVVVNTPVRSSETINTSELPKGAYLVKAYNTNGELVKTVKLIKN